MPRMLWRPGLRPGSRRGAHDAPPDPLVGWGGGHPLPKNPTSILAPSALDARHLRCLISSVYPPTFLAIHHWTPCNLSVLLSGNISHKIQQYGRTNRYLLSPGLIYQTEASILKYLKCPVQLSEIAKLRLVHPTQRTQRNVRKERNARHRFYPCVLAVASLASAAFVAYFSCVACVTCVKTVRKGLAQRALRWLNKTKKNNANRKQPKLSR